MTASTVTISHPRPHFARLARRSLLAAAGAALLSSRLIPAALAQGDWPAGKVVTWVVPYPAGGGTDVLGRNVAQRLGRLWAPT